MALHLTYSAHDPQQATAVVVDLRNFTPHLGAASDSQANTHQFCDFMARFHSICMQTADVALPPRQHASYPIHMASSGDGMLLVFLEEEHFVSAFTVAVLLHHQLDVLCHQYNANTHLPGIPPIGFGIGVESGFVNPIRAGAKDSAEGKLLQTVLGSCINIAARAQNITKTLAASRTIFAGTIVELVTKHLFQVDYQGLKAATNKPNSQFDEKTNREEEMAHLNRGMCIKYLHLHHLKGVNHPVDLYRLSENSLHLENPDFQRLLSHLASNDAHLDAIIDCIRTDETVENVN